MSFQGIIHLEALFALVLRLVGGVDPPLVLHQRVVRLEPLAAVSAGEGHLVVVLLAVTHNLLGSDLSYSTVRTEVDPVLGNIMIYSLVLVLAVCNLRIATEGGVVPDGDVDPVVRHRVEGDGAPAAPQLVTPGLRPAGPELHRGVLLCEEGLKV